MNALVILAIGSAGGLGLAWIITAIRAGGATPAKVAGEWHTVRPTR